MLLIIVDCFFNSIIQIMARRHFDCRVIVPAALLFLLLSTCLHGELTTTSSPSTVPPGLLTTAEMMTTTEDAAAASDATAPLLTILTSAPSTQDDVTQSTLAAALISPPPEVVASTTSTSKAKGNSSTVVADVKNGRQQRLNKTAPARSSATRKVPQVLSAIGVRSMSPTKEPTMMVNGSRNGSHGTGGSHHHNANDGAGNGGGGIGYGGEYADEWPIYVAILGLTVFAYVAWVLVYCLCQRRSSGSSYHSTHTTSTATLELAGHQHFNRMLSNQTSRRSGEQMPHLSLITNGAYYQHQPSVQYSSVSVGSPQCSLEGASLHEMIPPKYLQAMGHGGGAGGMGHNNSGFHADGNNNTLIFCDGEDFVDDGDETYVFVPRLNASRVYGSPPGYSDLTRISVMINAPSEEEDEAAFGGDTERNPLVSADAAATSVSRQASPGSASWLRRSVARLHSNTSTHSQRRSPTKTT